MDLDVLYSLLMPTNSTLDRDLESSDGLYWTSVRGRVVNLDWGKSKGCKRLLNVFVSDGMLPAGGFEMEIEYSESVLGAESEWNGSCNAIILLNFIHLVRLGQD